jgi:hypothetical protein
MPKPHSENAFAPMCTPPKGAPWFALAFIRDARQNARAEFIKAVSGNGRGWRALQAQGWRIVRVKVIEQTRETA